ncbi:deoxyribose-phosphate aldolase [Flavisolibacter nicotianae]|uniref:deoxyribose-phosphate aldolase n=1 Tax=Flavisolibacter nicotianae TaxID=2364882 RepID=UPI000EB521D3|nr:deoxyribose-phosphate aldolase [Flavisolibacter nicotianae]
MQLSKLIDHTTLKNVTTTGDIDKICSEALEYGFAAVCVPPYFVQDAKKLVGGSAVKVATVIGFPFGYHHYKTKLEEARLAIEEGADELDMVMNLAAFRSNDLAYVETEAEQLSRLTAESGKILKVIIESGILTDDEIIRCCELYKHFPVQFLKTSTGYAERGATVEAVRLMREHLPSQIQIKASGGIKTAEFAKQLVDAGATRLGCSASVAIVKGETGSGSY